MIEKNQKIRISQYKARVICKILCESHHGDKTLVFCFKSSGLQDINERSPNKFRRGSQQNKIETREQIEVERPVAETTQPIQQITFQPYCLSLMTKYQQIFQVILRILCATFWNALPFYPIPATVKQNIQCLAIRRDYSKTF